MSRKLVLAGLLVALFAMPAAHAGPVQTISSPPGASLPPGFQGYTSPVVVVSKSQPVTYLNLDPLFVHNVQATSVYGDGSAYWCVIYPEGACPLFWSTLVGPADPTTVLGISETEVGKTYAFHCSPHPWMKGLLVVVP